MLRPLALLAALATLGAAACGSERGGGAPAASPSPAAAAAPAGCRPVKDPGPKQQPRLPKPTARLAAGRTYVATVSTSCGDFQIRLDPRRAPVTGGSFAYLAGRRFYDGTTFHRIVPGFIIQGGDPEGTGEGGPGWSVVEAPPRALKYKRGVVAMAKTQTEAPGTSGSQFFVVTAQDAHLPPDYALLGRVTHGQDVVDRIGALPADQATEKPLQPVVIDRIRVSER